MTTGLRDRVPDIPGVREHWGRGIATEAGHATLRYGFEVLGLPHIVAVVRPENRASQRVLSKLRRTWGLRPHRRQPPQAWQPP